MNDSILMTAPLVAIELHWEDGDEIHACTQCYPWYAQLRHDTDTGEVRLLCWHAIGCPLVTDLGLENAVMGPF